MVTIGPGSEEFVIWKDSTEALRLNFDDTDYVGAAGGITLNEWTHVVFVRSGSAGTRYINGVSDGGFTDAAVLDFGSCPLIIGAWNAGGTGCTSTLTTLDGSVDDFRVYERALSVSEIEALAVGRQPSTSLGTYTLADPLSVAGTLTLNAGELDVSGSDFDVTASGGWENNGGVFTARGGEVLLDGADTQEVLSGSSAFNDLRVTNAAANGVTFTGPFVTSTFTAITADTNLTFFAGVTFTVTATLNIDGQATGTKITIDSSDSSTRFNFAVTAGTQTVDYVDVSNSEASSNDIRALHTNRGINTDHLESSPHWNFGPLRGAVMTVD